MTSVVSAHPPAEVVVDHGPRLLASIGDTMKLATHRQLWSDPRSSRVATGQLIEWARAVGIAGRGGAGFPFATKLAAAVKAAGLVRRPVIVVNAAEGEPASAKDFALALTVPHRVLDGAAATAYSLRCNEIHVVVPRDRPLVGEALRAAIAERRDAGERLSWKVTETGPGFVAGQARAVIEALSGRPGLPTTAWQPEAVSGLRGRPTLLSNAETWAQVGALVTLGPEAYAGLGADVEPGTTLLSLSGLPGLAPGTVRVVEVPYGTQWSEVLGDAVSRPVLVGGFHGTWAPGGALASMRVSRVAMGAMGAMGLTLGAGVAVLLPDGECPVAVTAAITAYLASESAGRCGPCFNGLPVLAAEVSALAGCDVGASYTRIRDLLGLVERRGACAHPDGTARLVRSMVTVFEDEVVAHLGGVCRIAEDGLRARIGEGMATGLAGVGVRAGVGAEPRAEACGEARAETGVGRP